jgi:tRNA A-37 threonylcarbamoyl transferase component Bud32
VINATDNLQPTEADLVASSFDFCNETAQVCPRLNFLWLMKASPGEKGLYLGLSLGWSTMTGLCIIGVVLGGIILQVVVLAVCPSLRSESQSPYGDLKYRSYEDSYSQRLIGSSLVHQDSSNSLSERSSLYPKGGQGSWSNPQKSWSGLGQNSSAQERVSGGQLLRNSNHHSASPSSNVLAAAIQAHALEKSQALGLRQIDPSELSLEAVIGEGSYGIVWRARWSGSAVAVKEFCFPSSAHAQTDSKLRENMDRIINQVVREAAIMAVVQHPKVLQLFGCSFNGPSASMWIVSELCARGSLREVLDDDEIGLPTSQQLRMAMDIAEGMAYLHNRSSPILHRDLKSHNLMVCEDFSVKIGDWGAARALETEEGGSGAIKAVQKKMTGGVGTVCWLAPEVIKQSLASRSSDVFSFGIIMWELATREEVHMHMTAAQIIAKVFRLVLTLHI